MGFSALNIGATAIITAGAQLNTTGNNTANANTEGYSRQKVNSKALNVNTSSRYSTGNGVDIASINRTVNDYCVKLQRTASNASNYYDELQGSYSTLETYMGELSDNDLSSLLNNFWSAMSNLSGDVTDDALRQQVLTTAQALSTGFNAIDSDLITLQTDINSEVKQNVATINTLTTQIATLNGQIVDAEAGGSSANTLRDTRDQLILQLSDIVDVNVQIDGLTGSLNVYNGNNPLVYRDQANELDIEIKWEDGLQYYMPAFVKNGVNIESEQGTLGAQMQMRDEIIPSYRAELDTLSANMIWQVNRITSQGTGLVGFSSLTGATEVEDPSVLLNKLDYGFVPSEGTYKIVDGSFEMTVHNTESGQEETFVIDVDLDGVGTDTILYDEEDPDASNSLINQMQIALEAAYPGAFTISLNEDNQVVIKGNSELYSLGFGRDSSGALAALGINTLFTGHDGGTIGVNEVVATNTDLLATGDSLNETGNETVQLLLELRNTTVMSGGKETMEGYYNSISVRLGNEANTTTLTFEYKADVLQQAKERVQTVSGVSLDEEATKLLAFQQAYQGASRYISVINECYQSILDMV